MNKPQDPTTQDHISHKMTREEFVHARLGALRIAHRELDEEIQELIERQTSRPLALQRLKKQKLMLKDEIARLQDEATPDIIA